MIKLIKSFKFALQGLKENLIYERNFQLMIVVALLVIFAMFYFKVSSLEKAVLFTTIFSVLILELFNNVVERIMDFIQPKYDEQVKIIKDLSAAIVLIASLGAIIIGLIIFIPHFLRY
ncbi:MAG: diacylglycerol kinase family protein [Patescibacteria group bacterium]